MGRLAKISIGLTAGLLLGAGWIYVRNGGHKGVDEALDPSCKRVTATGSAEDIEIHNGSGKVYLSLLDRTNRDPTTTGVIALYEEGAIRPLSAAYPVGFKPHGLAIYDAPSGDDTLFAINHPVVNGVKVHRIERFTLAADGTISWRGSIESPLFTSPNDLVAVGPDAFYVVNDSSGRGQGAAMAEMFLPLNRSTIVHYRDGKTKIVRDNMPGMAGVALDASGRRLAVSVMGSRTIAIFRLGADGGLAPDLTIGLEGVPDNITAKPSGWLVAEYLNSFAVAGHFISGGNKPSPSVISEIDHQGQVLQRMADSGAAFSVASVAQMSGTHMLVGSITAHGILDCPQ